ncbi:hypothetical protein OEIGOIKO_05736 [Streptomyces chrestomyceticus JCM 4735]|uniref:Holin n=1 Tax=Streptomyces chrestomyceticus JCM 4735 TaxID=1306181 RepID=A0A7U9L1L7_9ACTN|nr:hypothetical protein [Streptomyces chrestomyceticus]GCD37926.1 hypothetical protein OEIGOIKO_05736 [Streptomyces chrestomyceticus JCM 4735]
MTNVTTISKTAQTYARDLAERVVWTFLVAAGGVALAAGPGDMFDVSFWQAVGAAGIAAVGSLVKGFLARVIGDKNSASTARGV